MHQKAIKGGTSASATPTTQTEIDESVLNAILEQLNKERIKRAEVESELFNLKRKIEDEKNNNIDADNESKESSSDIESYLSLSFDFDEADRVNKVNNILSEFESIKDDKKRNKRALSLLLTKLFNDLQDTLLIGLSGNSSKARNAARLLKQSSKELRVKDGVSKVMSAFNQKSFGGSWKFDKKSMEIVKQIIDKNTSEFVNHLKRLSSVERLKDLEDEMEKMRMDLITIRKERDGFLEIIGALSPNDSDAISMSCKKKPGTLPLDVVQLLELTPWDDRVQFHVAGSDSFDQWQVYDVKTKKWADKIELFPNNFQPSLSNKLDSTVSKNPLDYFSLPSTGRWQWIGNWKIEGVPHHHSSQDNDEGWTYANKPEYLKLKVEDKCFNEPYGDQSGKQGKKSLLHKGKGIPLRRYRRRTWSRQRVLQSYPGISRRTEKILNLFELNAKLSLTVEKLHDQVFQMQNQLMDKEEFMDKTTIELRSQLSELELENDKNANELDKKSKECNQLKKQVQQKPSQAGDKTIPFVLQNSKEFLSPIKPWGSKDVHSPLSDHGFVSLFGHNKKSGMSKPTKAKNDDDDTSADTVTESKDEYLPKTLSKESKDNSPPTHLKIPKLTLDEDSAEILFQGSADKKVEETKLPDADEEEEDLTIFEVETVPVVEPQWKANANKQSFTKPYKSPLKNRSKERSMNEAFNWGKMNLIEKVKNKVKDVENNVRSVKTDVQAIAGKAQSFQKIASQVK